ncbi:MAG: tRNA (N6-isopentenyl adenosine(37)-C2)-methylthiotransferase MiaB [Deltaproteobacteria bacterium]|nr:tRNA (N6-isopentenyl adenosine(37)-C2)-methylthiotransferase MiaB [Deltaproteobacteria bacterium]
MEARFQIPVRAGSKKVFFHTFGCQMNEYDTGKMRAQLEPEGYAVTTDPTEADLILLNTCSVRDKAVQKMHSALGEYRRLKRRGQDVVIGIAGCVSQVEGEELLRRYPDVELIFGPDAVTHVGRLVREAEERRGQVLDTDLLDLAGYPFVSDLDPGSTGQVSAFVTIQKGCDNKCTFCIVPATRGAEVSRPHAEIVDEVRRLVDTGVKEITLIGQNVNSYGLKHPGEITFSELLFRVHAVLGVQRIRYTTSHPRDVTDDLVAAYRELPRLTSHLHLPVQSGSNRVLRRMKRFYTRERFLEVVAALRQARPDIAISTDWIVGFPGETDDDFAQTMTLLDEVRFTAAFSFKYSPRPGTAALHYKEGWDDAVSARRLEVLQKRQRDLSAAFHAALVGQGVEVLVEGWSKHDPGVICGRTSTNAMVNFPGAIDEVGDLVQVHVTRGFTHSCRGERPPP